MKNIQQLERLTTDAIKEAKLYDDNPKFVKEMEVKVSFLRAAKKCLQAGMDELFFQHELFKIKAKIKAIQDTYDDYISKDPLNKKQEFVAYHNLLFMENQVKLLEYILN
jgi:hypothetical protein